MVITWHGLSCLKIGSKNQSGDITIIIDPYEKQGAMRIPRTATDVAIITDTDSKEHNNKKGVTGDPFIVDTQGEFEVKGVMMRMIEVNGNSTKHRIASLIIEGIHIAVITALSKELTEDQLDHIGAIDVLAIAVGDKKRLELDRAVKVVQEIEPRIVIPIHYHMKGFQTKLDPVDKFVKAVGITPQDSQEKLRLSRKDLPSEDTQLVILGE